MFSQSQRNEFNSPEPKASLFRPRIIAKRDLGDWGCLELTQGPLINIGLILVVFALIDSLQMGLAVAVIFFSALVLHEFGHAAAARLLGKPVATIRIGGLGGYCVANSITRARDRLLFALGGVIANFVLGIASLAFMVAMIIRAGGDTQALLAQPVFLWSSIAVCANAYFVVVNLLPAWGHDGTTCLHVVLLRVTTEATATRICAGAALVTTAFGAAVTFWIYTQFGVIIPLILPFGNAWQVLRGGGALPTPPQASPA